jgi:hypothetical protein
MKALSSARENREGHAMTDYYIELVDIEDEDRFLWFRTEESRDAAALRELKAGHTVKYETKQRSPKDSNVQQY